MMDTAESLRPYAPRLTLEWLRDTPTAVHRRIEGSLVFADISGFTSMTERLARKGKIGAEEVSDLLSATFTELLSVADANGADLLKWGGDAVLLLFRSEDHAAASARAAHGMRATMRRIGRLRTSAGVVRLRISFGIHSGAFDLFLVGDPEVHRELLITGPGATRCAQMEGIAEAGEIALSPETAALLPRGVLGEPKEEAVLLTRAPKGASSSDPPIDASGLDLASCLPVPIRRHLLAGAVEAEHRPVTAAFVEFMGTDAWLGRSDPEVLAGALDHVVRAAQHAARHRGVTFFETDISKDGGKIMMIAGAPVTTGHDEEAMLLTAREIVEAGGELPVRVGVNAGHVFSGDFGPPFRRTYSVKGDAINLAARVMGKAEPGQVLATAPVLERSQRDFATEPLPPFTVKGKGQPVQAFAVGPSLGRRTAGSADVPPMVGREQELGLLLDELELARAGQVRAVEIVGEPGIGKSRLMEELCARVPPDRLVTVAAEEYEASTPYFVTRSLLREALGVEDTATAAEAGERLLALLGADAPELLRWSPLLALAIDADVPPTQAVDRLADENKPAILRRAVTDLLGAVCANTTAWVVEDLHWADEPSVEVLGALVTVPARPWLVCVTRRPEGAPFLEEGVGVSLELEPLGEAGAVELARTAAEGTALSPHATAALVQRAGGNPLFIRELVQVLRLQGDVESLPGTVEEVIGARIDHLAPADRRVLRSASVLGPSFDRELLVVALGEEVPSVSAGTWRRLRDFVVPEGDGSWRFAHALIRDVAYEGLPYKRRWEAHARVGRVLEERAGADVDEVCEALSMHFHLARDWERSWRYSVLAGDRARAKYANVQAASFYERALESSRRRPVQDVVELATVWESLGDVSRAAGVYERADAAFRAAIRLAQQGESSPTASVRLLAKRGMAAERAERFTAALRWYAMGQRLAETYEPTEVAMFLFTRASLRFHQGRPREAKALLLRAAEAAEASRNLPVLANCYLSLYQCDSTLGEESPREYAQLALEMHEQLGDRSGQAIAHQNLGVRAYYKGRWDEAQSRYSRSMEIQEEIGNLLYAAEQRSNLAELLSDRGHLREAEDLLRENVLLFRAMRHRGNGPFALMTLGRTLARAGRSREALETLQQAKVGFDELHDQISGYDVDARIAEALAIAGGASDALAVATGLLRGAPGETPFTRILVLRVQACALAGTGDLDGALRAADASLGLARTLHAPFEIALTLEVRAQLREMTGVTGADADAREAHCIFERLGVVAAPAMPVAVHAS